MKDYGEIQTDRVIDIYVIATKIARDNNQIVGENNDYYITLEQLMNILK